MNILVYSSLCNTDCLQSWQLQSLKATNSINTHAMFDVHMQICMGVSEQWKSPFALLDHLLMQPFPPFPACAVMRSLSINLAGFPLQERQIKIRDIFAGYPCFPFPIALSSHSIILSEKCLNCECSQDYDSMAAQQHM